MRSRSPRAEKSGSMIQPLLLQRGNSITSFAIGLAIPGMAVTNLYQCVGVTDTDVTREGLFAPGKFVKTRVWVRAVAKIRTNERGVANAKKVTFIVCALPALHLPPLFRNVGGKDGGQSNEI